MFNKSDIYLEYYIYLMTNVTLTHFIYKHLLEEN